MAIIPIQLFLFIAWGRPDAAIGWFALFENNPLHGLLAFELLFVINATFGIATTLAFYVALRRVSESLMTVALALVEAVALIVARPAFLSYECPRATVGGWLATDGLGVGSFEYGRLRENVLSASVVLPGIWRS